MNPIEVVEAFIKAFEKKDYDTAVKYVAPNCQYTNPPPIGTVNGPEGVRAVLEPFFAPVIKNEIIIRNAAASGNTVFLERLDRHRLPSKWVELPVTGVFTVENGLIAIWDDYFDLASFMGEWPQAEGVAAK